VTATLDTLLGLGVGGTTDTDTTTPTDTSAEDTSEALPVDTTDPSDGSEVPADTADDTVVEDVGQELDVDLGGDIVDETVAETIGDLLDDTETPIVETVTGNDSSENEPVPTVEESLSSDTETGLGVVTGSVGPILGGTLSGGGPSGGGTSGGGETVAAVPLPAPIALLLAALGALPLVGRRSRGSPGVV
jgi:hypothetical protein